MSSGMEFFLTEELRPKKHDRCNMPHYALDNELMHQEIIALLLTKSPEFCTRLLGSTGKLDRHSQEFDIWMRLDVPCSLACLEIKVWHHWSDAQMGRQIAELGKCGPAQGYAVLLGNASSLSRKKVDEITKGTFRKIAYKDLCSALDVPFGDETLKEVAAAYKIGLSKQRDRLRKQYPNVDPDE